ncbi:MAG TPA: calcium/sodium antiporter [Nannocystis exedens]|nr:calcium/sodium antiporter [Nannocystis exedens]
MSATTITLFVIGLLFLLGGADVLIRGASAIARRLGISPLMVGLTIVSLGTSAPEVAVSVTSAYHGEADMALGNVLGSNIFNILAILGSSALVAPLIVQRQLIRFDVPVMIMAALATFLLALDGTLNALDGTLLLSGLMLYTLLLVRIARRSADKPPPAENASPRWSQRLWVQLAMIVIGLALLVIGSGWLVDGAIIFARLLGVSELVIGLTIIAVGTSLPELATSIIAVAKGERDIAVGNAIGSNILNLLLVLGLTSVVSPTGIPVPQEAIGFDIPVMLAVCFACLPSFITGSKISRWEGGFFVGYYIAYTLFLVLSSLSDSNLGSFSRAMLWFVIPLTVLVFAFTLVQELVKQKPNDKPSTADADASTSATAEAPRTEPAGAPKSASADAPKP